MLLNLDILPIPSDSISTQAIQKADRNMAAVSEFIKKGDFGKVFDTFITWGIGLTMKIIVALLIFMAGRWIIRKLTILQDKIWTRRKMDETLKNFLKNFFSIAAYLALFIFIINLVGAQTVSFAALVASAGLAVGLAVKDNLSNFAGGVMLLLNKPFKCGDFIEAQNLSGTVRAIGILYTTLTSSDNKTVYIPNGPLSTGSIVNYNSQPTRKGEIVLNLNYDGDSGEIKKLLLDIAGDHPKILKTPEPFARLTQIKDNSLEFSLRVWIKTKDYWDVIYDLNETIYKKLSEKGLNLQTPQMNVYLTK